MKLAANNHALMRSAKYARNKRGGCCGETLILANKTACLSYQKCNDRELDWFQSSWMKPRLHNDTLFKSIRKSAFVARSQMQMPTSKVPSGMITWESAWSVGDLIVNRVRSH